MREESLLLIVDEPLWRPTRHSSPERAVAAEVIRQAYLDAFGRQSTARVRLDAILFFRDWRLAAWCHVLDCPADRVRADFERRLARHPFAVATLDMARQSLLRAAS